MKKEVCVLVLVLLMASFVIAEDLNDSDFIDVTPDGFKEVSGIRNKSNEILVKEIEIPENLQIFSKILFGLKSEGQVNLQQFIIMFGVFLFTLLLLKSIIELIPMFGEGWKSWSGAILVMVLVSISGGTLLAVDFILSLSTFFGLLAEWGVVNLAFALVLLVGLFYLFSVLLRYFKRKTNLAGAEEVRDSVAYLSAAGKAAREGMKMARGK